MLIFLVYLRVACWFWQHVVTFHSGQPDNQTRVLILDDCNISLEAISSFDLRSRSQFLFRFAQPKELSSFSAALSDKGMNDGRTVCSLYITIPRIKI